MNYKKLLIFPFVTTPLFSLAQNSENKGVATKQSTPNVILILADDLGYGDLQCYGAKNVETPNVNKLAQQGICFTNAHAVAATSTPSRYSILTGEYAWRRKDTDVAAGNAGMIIRPNQYTMADMFKSAGYKTAAIGKWHLGVGEKTGEQDWNAKIPIGLEDIGFDYHYIMAATADRVPCVFIENGVVANYDVNNPIYVSYSKNFEGEPTAKDNPQLLYNQKSSHGHDMSIVNGIGRIGYMKGGGKALWKDENIADTIVVKAVDFIKKNKENPFFMYFATNDIHVPRFPNKRFVGKTQMGVRGDAIVQFDWCVGEIMKILNELGIAKNTLIILTSDNGPVLDDGYVDGAVELLNGHKPSGKFRGYKYSCYEGGTAVPAIISWPNRVEEGKISDALISQIDLIASLGALLKVNLLSNSAPDSYNYIGTLLGENEKDRPWVIEQSNYHVLSVRTKKWKYIEPSDKPKKIPWGADIETGNSTEHQLFKMKGDLSETKNVAHKHKRVVRRMQEILKEERML